MSYVNLICHVWLISLKGRSFAEGKWKSSWGGRRWGRMEEVMEKVGGMEEGVEGKLQSGCKI